MECLGRMMMRLKNYENMKSLVIGSPKQNKSYAIESQPSLEIQSHSSISSPLVKNTQNRPKLKLGVEDISFNPFTQGKHKISEKPD